MTEIVLAMITSLVISLVIIYVASFQRRRLRDRFAGHALAGLIAATPKGDIPQMAYRVADAMLKAREGPVR